MRPNDPKVVMLGDTGVGKSSILCRLCRGKWDIDVFTTIGNAFITHTFHVRGQDCKLCIWDTPGQEQYAAQSTLCVRDAAACVVLYDVSRPSTFENVERHVSRYVSNCQLRDPFVVIAGNKSDLLAPDDVQRQIDLLAALENGPCAKTFLVSAKSGEQVQELFQLLAAEVVHRHIPADDFHGRDNRFNLNRSLAGGTKTSGACC
jgi:small GTP-binding protein